MITTNCYFENFIKNSKIDREMDDIFISYINNINESFKSIDSLYDNRVDSYSYLYSRYFIYRFYNKFDNFLVDKEIEANEIVRFIKYDCNNFIDLNLSISNRESNSLDLNKTYFSDYNTRIIFADKYKIKESKSIDILYDNYVLNGSRLYFIDDFNIKFEVTNAVPIKNATMSNRHSIFFKYYLCINKDLRNKVYCINEEL